MNIKRTALAAAMALSCLPIWAAVTADTQEAVELGVKVQVNETTCGEMLVQTGSTRDFTMIFMHGFISGMKNDLLFDAVKVSEATDKVYDMCVADPKANLLEVFKKARG